MIRRAVLPQQFRAPNRQTFTFFLPHITTAFYTDAYQAGVLSQQLRAPNRQTFAFFLKLPHITTAYYTDAYQAGVPRICIRMYVYKYNVYIHQYPV